jgi:hypothetical protein
MRRPLHYKTVDPIALMQSQLTPEMVYGFYIGNVLKYAARAHLKGKKADLKKCQDYIDRALKL